MDAAQKALEKQRQAGLAAMAKQEAKERELAAAINKEVKSNDDLKAKTSAMIKVRDSMSRSTKAEKEEYERLTKEINKNVAATNKENEAIGRNQGSVGKYQNALKGVGTKLLGFASALGVAFGAAELFKSVLGSTQAIADDFAKNLEGGKQAIDFLSRAIVNLDFSNLIQGMKDAFEEGKRYANVLDEIADRQRSLGIQKLDIEGQIIDQKIIAKNRQLDIKDREAAINKIVELEQLKLDKTSDIAKQGIENELSDAAQISGLQTDVIKDFVTNYDDYSQRITNGIELQNKLNSLITTTQSASGFIVKDYFKRDEALKNLTETEKESIRFAELSNKITDEKRDKIGAAIQLDIEATNEQKRSGEELIMLQNRLYKELIREGETNEKEKDKKIKGEKELSDTIIDYSDETTKIIIDNAQKQADARIKAEKDYQDAIGVEFDLPEEETIPDASTDPAVIAAGERAMAIVDFARKQVEDQQEIFKVSIDEIDSLEEQGVLTHEEAEAAKTEITKEETEKRKEIAQEAFSMLGELGNALFEIGKTNLDQEMADLEEQKANELALVGDNASAKEGINERYAEKEKALKMKQDKADKQSAEFKAAINLALAVTAALTTVPPASFVFAAATAVLAGIELAAIIARPLPKYFKGREGGPSEFAITGDRGSEIIDIPNRGQFLTPNRSTLTFLPEGASVIPHAETMERLSNPGLRQMEDVGTTDIRLLRKEVTGLYKGFTMLADVVKNKKEFNLNITEKGMYLAVKNGESWVKYVNENINM